MTKWMQWLLPAAALATLAGCGGDGDPPMQLAEKCPTLQGKMLGGGSVVIDDARLAAAAPPQPEYCVVTARFKDSALRFEARLPTTGWNGKLAFLGGGGFDGAMPTAAAAQFSESILTERYATIGTNGGYDYPPPRDLGYFKGEFALDAAKLLDFAQQSEHRALQPGKEVMAQFFGKPPARSYFEGCSMGGHDALMQAQRFPEDFDGIVARAPAGNVMGLFMQFNRIARQVQSPGGALNPAKQSLLATAVLAQCDGLDGLSDGIIARPAACRFDAKALRCTGGGDTGDSCLSDAQIATVQTVTSPIATANGAWSHPGYPFGAENSPKGWGEYIWPQASLGGASAQGLFSDGFIRSFIARDASFDTTIWNPEQWLARMDTIGGLFGATDSNLAALHARGARLILWNGTTDTSVSALDTARYYDQVVSTLGQRKADEAVELFLAPGVGHCFGGAGPDKVDLLQAMATWVEQGVPASQQKRVLRKVEASGATTMSRPMCRYPAYPRYKGTGNASEAASFDCVTD
ncbi:tannase/feruloyl esterase family alpha/beta hydrolase [Acidovorax sp.]|uniref:tannase/feruloyl esterase family alpha/beta hydrolase n=1 Tax=Acidovorax sp. TaxID=1872122 RepID=UPI00391FBB7A